MHYRGYPPPPPNGTSMSEYPSMYHHNSMNRMAAPVRGGEMNRMYPSSMTGAPPNMAAKPQSAHLARLLCSSPSLSGSPAPNNHLPASLGSHITSPQHSSQSFGTQPSVMKKEMAFPLGSVEASQPTMIRHKKLAPKDLPQVDPWRLMMSLKSGLLAETTWALDVLTVLVSHDNTYLFFGLPHLPGLLDTLLEHYKKCLNEIFDNLVKDSELGVSRSIKKCERKRKKKWYEICSYDKDCDLEQETKRLNGVPEMEEKKEEDCIMEWDKISSKMEMFQDIPKNDQYLRILRSSMNYTLKSRVGKAVKVEETESLFISDYDKKWDNLQKGFKVEREHWRKGFTETTDHILTHFEPKEKPIKLVKLIKHHRRKSSSSRKPDNEQDTVPHPSDLQNENFVRSQELAESVKQERSKRSAMNCVYRANNVTIDSRDKEQSRRQSSELFSECKAVTKKDCRESTASTQAKNEEESQGKLHNFSSSSSSSSSTPSNSSRSIIQRVGSNSRPDSSDVLQPVSSSRTRVATDTANFDELEEEVDSEESSPLHPVFDYCDSLTKRCLCVSTLIRNLSFVPMNDVEMSRHAGLLLVLGRLLKIGHTHNLKKRSFEKPEKTEENGVSVVSSGGLTTISQLTHLTNANFSFQPASPSRDRIEKEIDQNTVPTNGLGESEKSNESSCLLKEEDHEEKETKEMDEDSEDGELGKGKSWWSEAIHLIRENTLVTLANISSQLDLEPYPEDVSLTLLDGLFHWATCPSAYAQDQLPSTSIQSLCPRRLALESLMKLSIFDNNVDLLLATPPWERQERMLTMLSKMLNRSEDQTLREFALVLLTNFASADTAIARAIAMNGIAIGQLISFIEQSEQAALNVVHTHGINALKENPELMGTTLDMVRRAAICLLQFARIPDNRPLLLAHQQRLLALAFSQILDQGVGAIIADLIYELSLHEESGVKFLSDPVEKSEANSSTIIDELDDSSDLSSVIISTSVSTSHPTNEPDAALPLDIETASTIHCSSILEQKINGNGTVEESEKESEAPQNLETSKMREDFIKEELITQSLSDVTEEKCIEKHNCNGEGLTSANQETLVGFSKLESVNMNHISTNQV